MSKSFVSLLIAIFFKVVTNIVIVYSITVMLTQLLYGNTNNLEISIALEWLYICLMLILYTIFILISESVIMYDNINQLKQFRYLNKIVGIVTIISSFVIIDTLFHISNLVMISEPITLIGMIKLQIIYKSVDSDLCL